MQTTLGHRNKYWPSNLFQARAVQVSFVKLNSVFLQFRSLRRSLYDPQIFPQPVSWLKMSDLWRMLINGCSSWFFSRSPKKPAVCPLAPILSTGSRSQWKLWTRFGWYLLNSKGLPLKRTCFASLNTNFIDHILFSRDQRINLAWCYGTPPPTCWWRGSPCSTPSSPWSPSSGAPSASSLASPSWLSGMEQKCSLKCPYPHSWKINRLTFSLDKFCHIFIASCFK